ncbi:TonB-dependent receptor plug domain-containing protein [Flavobacterium sp. WC2509]|uniref:TonB-dependent receptor plug domain-containing protein n=1 Tax=Flavobacterium sp. WC2509 TaxID=3461406 RepID=UPI0040442879
MTLRKLILAFFVLMCQFVSAQNDSINKLKEVIVSDRTLYSSNKSQSIQILNDSVIGKNQSTLTNLLNYNSVLYFKEYGRGMTSTVSFRGTTASQTAVVWNGINVNSLLNGSADFNTFTSSDFSAISVKAGGGSVSYGSGAIGGSVHLNNNLVFKDKFENDLRLDYGSFNTIGANYKMNLSSQKWSTQIGFSRNSSDNDYDYIGLYTWKGVQRKNENGQYATTSLSANVGYKIKPNAVLTLYSQSSNTDRNLSLVSESDSKTKYINTFSRNLLEYSETEGRFSSNYKAAYLTEQYQYFADIESNYFTFGKSESFIAKMDFGYQLIESIKLNGIVDYSSTKGFGTSFGDNTRHIGAVALKVVEKANSKWQNELGFRKEASSDYDSPFLFSLGSSYAFSSFYNLKINFSRNFRIPTFNDLYWEEGGNPDLKPESSYQTEIGNVFKYKKITLSETIYYNKIDDLIRWIPMNGDVWSPENTDRVNTYGSETILGWANSYGKNSFAINGTYAYTISKNVETGKQLFFVPYHKATASLAYSYGKFSVDYQYLYNGFVYTRSDNDPNEIIDAYQVSNVGLSYDFKFLESSKIGFQVLNVFNEKYESVEDRPMAGRNFNMYITLKF